jgi:AcrR family transcriptional regulator
MLDMRAVENGRHIPRQSRSRATLDVVIEAAAQLLEDVGEDGFNTNAVAARAGVSIGSLYRYFPDKRSILTALARREMETVNVATAKALAGEVAGIAPDRAAIRAFLQAFGGRTKARRTAVAALLAHSDPEALAVGFRAVEARFVDADGRPLRPVATFVLSRAVHGAMRAAVLEGADFLLAPEFEDELVRLSRSYLGYAVPERP